MADKSHMHDFSHFPRLPPLNPAASSYSNSRACLPSIAAPPNASSRVRPLPLPAVLSSTQPLQLPPIRPTDPVNPSHAKPLVLPRKPAMPAPARKRLAIITLLSPPDTLLDSFCPATPPFSSVVSSQSGAPTSMPMSPPVSPMQHSFNWLNLPPTNPMPTPVLQDPILFPTNDTRVPRSQPPMFDPIAPPRPSYNIRHPVLQYAVAAPTCSSNRVQPPVRDEGVPALDFRSSVIQMFSMDPVSWLKKERSYLMADKYATQGSCLVNKLSAAANPRPHRSRPNRPNTRPDRVLKKSQAVAGSTGLKIIRANPSPLGQHPAMVTETRRLVAPSREDRDFAVLLDYCPPIASLSSRPRSLRKADWKGTPIDLSDDPNISLLHPDEVSLAASLRLDCATYLTTKRRIFIRRLECARAGKDFRKTDAQQSCKIDVNKASKLWTAYQEVGWFGDEWIAPFVN